MGYSNANKESAAMKNLGIALGLLMLAAASISAGADDTVPATNNPPSTPAVLTKHAKANYELAARWTPAKVAKMVSDTSVTPHCMDTADRFWSSFESNGGPPALVFGTAERSERRGFGSP